MIKRFHRMLENLHVGCEAPRAYFVPFESAEKTALPREDSAFLTLLNGEWDFAFFKNVEELDIEAEDFSSSVVCPDKMTVPFCWQMKLDRGYDVPNYINQDYPYPVDPPHLPDVIPCGFYRRKIDFAKAEGKKYFINFEGVAPCFYLWVNGSFVGYSQVSHNTSELEITDKLVNGENVFEVLVVKWCDGSYLEDQDFFRLSGIFRDVYILERDETYLKDIYIEYSFADDFSHVDINADITLTGEASVSWTLTSPCGCKVADGKADGSFTIGVDSPVLWNTENPQLYNLTLNIGNEWINFPLAVRKAEIKNRCFLFNGKLVKIRGINRHDSNPETGYAVDMDHMTRDLYILKQGNVNAIRTSHYPNDPRFLELCDKLGFMVIDEADIETHGMGYNYGDWYWDYWAFLSDTPEWREAYLDRAARLFERDKNHGCVIMWSLGNESGCGENHRQMANYIRSRKKDAIIHYENAHLEYQSRLCKDFSDISDVESRMYAPLDYLESYLENLENQKPFYYCEYVAAWSTGDIPLHWGKFEKYDNYMGGCIWEYCDHAVNIGTKENPKYRYGGDFGDLPNDKIYCVDGLVYPDRRLRPGFHDMKITYQPFDITYNDGTVTVLNKRYFTALDDLGFKWSIEKNGKTVKEGVIEKAEIAARKEAEYKLFDDIQADELTTLKIIFFQNSDTPWAEKGFEVGYKQFILSDSAVSVESKLDDAVKYEENRTAIKVICGETIYTFDKILGKISSINNGKELLSAPIEFNINRSYHLSNGFADQWKRARYEQVKQKTYSSEITEASDDKLVITTKVSFAAAAMPPAIRADVIYTFTSDGKLNISVRSVVTYNAPALPRFGIKLVMPEGFENVTYLGYGPVETYSDRYISQMISEYSTTATDSFEHYIKPQECASHYKTKTASVKDADGNGLSFADTSVEGFCFKAIHYDDAQLHETLHDDELTALAETIVSLDYKMHADCQEYADLEPWRKFEEKEFAFSYDIIPE
ncbi:MAG: DUF4981 domain-containing protein [Clostridia bacterium]|nr:DUF4981 domain-containing protein [Clostridia bacterium]